MTVRKSKQFMRSARKACAFFVLTCLILTGLCFIDRCETVYAAADLSVSASADVTSGVRVGDTITYTVTVTNTGDEPISNILVTDDHTVLYETINTLDTSASSTYNGTYMVTQADVDAGNIVYTVTAAGQTSGGVSVEDFDDMEVTTVEAHSGISVTLSASPSTEVHIGDDITFTLVVTNTGNVTVTDISPISSLFGSNVGGTFNLSPGQDNTVTYTYTVAGSNNGKVTETVTVAATAIRGDDPQNAGATAEATLMDIVSTPIVITSSNKSWTYDGQTHKDETYTVTYGGSAVVADQTGKVFTLPTGDKLTITPTAAGVKDYSENYSENNTFSYSLEYADYYSNVTKNVGTLSIEKCAVTATITGKSKTVEYNGKEQSVEGYDFESSNSLYTRDGFSFSGEAIAKGTDVGSYDMGLADDQFRNINDNFDVTFEVVKDGVLTIKPKEDQIEWNNTNNTAQVAETKQSEELEASPQTGDTSNMTCMVALFGVAMAAMLAVILKRIKEARE